MKPRLILGLGLGVLFVVAGGVVTQRALSGHGPLNELARGLYHAYKERSVQAAVLPERADAPLVIYDDKLGDGWQDWSWGTRDLAHLSPVHSGKSAIYLKPGGNRGLFLHHDSDSTGGYGTLSGFVSGETRAKVCLVDPGNKFGPTVALSRYLSPDPAGRIGWQKMQIPLADLGAPRGGEAISGIVFQPEIKAALPLILDDLSLQPDLTLKPTPTAATVAVIINVQAGRHPISPFIYGMAFAPDDYLMDLKLGLNRWGGNDKSRYNWVQGNAENAARDWSSATALCLITVCRWGRPPPPTTLSRATKRVARRRC